jgi:hypothetical protein
VMGLVRYVCVPCRVNRSQAIAAMSSAITVSRPNLASTIGVAQMADCRVDSQPQAI